MIKDFRFKIKDSLNLKFLILNLLILNCLVGCKAIEILTGIGAGASMAGLVAPAVIQASGQVKPKDVLAKIDLAYQEYDAQVENIMHNVGLTPKERKAMIKEKTRVLNSRVKAYNRLLADSYGFPRELVDYLGGPEGQEAISVIAKALPPPWNELMPAGASLGLLIATILGFRGRGRFKNIALLLGNTIEGLRKSGILKDGELIEATKKEASEHRLSMADLHGFLKRYNVS